MMDDEARDQPEIPVDWDVLKDDDSATVAGGLPADLPTPDEPPADAPAPATLVVVAASWADAVTILAVVTGALLVLNAAGFDRFVAALPWALLLAVTWWLFAAALCVAVRQATPGMLLAGIQFGDRVTSARLVFVLLSAAVSAFLLGAPALGGARRSPLALAGNQTITVLARR